MPRTPAVADEPSAADSEPTGEVRAKPLPVNASSAPDTAARFRAAGERVARDHEEILRALAK